MDGTKHSSPQVPFLDEIVSRLLEAFHPQEILLVGSWLSHTIAVALREGMVVRCYRQKQEVC